MATYANVMSRLDEKMSKGQQIKILVDVFGYSKAAASQYLTRNNVKCSGRERAISVYDVEKYLWADMTQSEKIKTIVDKLNVKYYTAWYFIKLHPDCGRKAKTESKPIEQVVEVKTESKPIEVIEEKTDVQTVDNLSEIKKTISEIEALEAQLKEKKEWLKLLIEDYVKC